MNKLLRYSFMFLLTLISGWAIAGQMKVALSDEAEEVDVTATYANGTVTLTFADYANGAVEPGRGTIEVWNEVAKVAELTNGVLGEGYNELNYSLSTDLEAGTYTIKIPASAVKGNKTDSWGAMTALPACEARVEITASNPEAGQYLGEPTFEVLPGEGIAVKFTYPNSTVDWFSTFKGQNDEGKICVLYEDEVQVATAPFAYNNQAWGYGAAFDYTVVEGKTYKVVFPAGCYYIYTVDNDGNVAEIVEESSEQSYEWTGTAGNDGEGWKFAAVTPAEGKVESLHDLTFAYPAGIMWVNESVTLDIKSGDDTVAQIMMHDNFMGACTGTVLDVTLTEDGTYVLNIPAGKFTDQAGNPNAEMTYTWTIGEVEDEGGDDTGWDGTVTTSLGETVITSISDLDNLVLTFPGAKSIEILGEDDCFYMTLGNKDGSKLYGVWAPTMGSDYKIEGNQITLDGFMPMDGATTTIPAGTTKLYIEDYGTLVIDGESDYIETIELNANIAAAAEPFMLTAISNNGVNGNFAGIVKASEAGVSKTFVISYDKKLVLGDAAEYVRFSMLQNDDDFGDGFVTITESGATISFNEVGAASFTKAGTYALFIPEGVFVDEEGTPNAAIYAKWIIIQGDEPGAGVLANTDFAEGVVGNVNIATYEKDGTPNQMQEVPGWSFGVANGDAKASAVVAYGSATTLNGAAYTVPAAGPEGTNGNALAMVGVWTGTVQYVQYVELPAGKYTMIVPVYNTVGATAFVKNLIGVKVGGTEHYATATSYPVGKWTNEVVTFELDEDATVTFSLGYEGANCGSAAAQHLFIDRVDVEAYDELAVAKTTAIAALPVAGEGIFANTAEEIDAAKAAIEAATTVEEVEAVTLPAVAALSGEWVIFNTTAENYLGANSEANVILAADQVNVTFEKAVGGFYIKAGEVYINMKGGNTWSMSADAEAKTAWNFNLADGKYSIQGPNGLIGTDNAAAGSACYGNKAVANNGLWTIEVAPSTDPIDMTDKIINPQFQDALNGWHLQKLAEEGNAPSTGVKGPADNKVITAFNTSFDCQQTIEGLEAGWYKLSVQAFARPTAHANTQKMEDNPAAYAEHTNFIYANDAQKRAMLITEDGSKTEISGALKLNSGLWVPTSSNTTAAAFSQGLYDQSLLFQVAEDGKAVIGVKGSLVEGDDSYYGFDNFRLTRVFVADAADVEALMAAVPEGAMDAQVKAAMDAAVEALGKKASIDNFLAAEKAVAAAKASVAEYAAVKALMDSEAAKAVKLEVSAEYAAGIAEVSAAYENGSIEDIEAAENVVKSTVVKAYCADMEAGKDLTALLNNTTFDDNTVDGWDMIGSLTAKSHVARSFEANYDISQTLFGLPAGTYKMALQIFGRGMSNNDMIAALVAGEELPNNQTYFYANEVVRNAPQITSETIALKGEGDWNEMPDGTWIPANAAATEVVFNAGLYQQELLVEVGENGILKLGVKMEGDHAGRYSGLDNITLTYVGNTEDMELVDGVAYVRNTDKDYKTLTYTRTFNNTGWQAFYVPFAMSYEDWSEDFEVAAINMFHQYDEDEDGIFDSMEMEVRKVKAGTLKPNHPYLIKAKTTGEKTISLTDATLYAADENSFECNSMEMKYTFTGTYTGVTGSTMVSEGYYSMGGGNLIQAENASANLNPFRWYLKMEARDGQVILPPTSVKVCVWGEDDEEDGILSLDNENDDAPIYNLNGTKVVNANRPGLYIKNGKKYVVR